MNQNDLHRSVLVCCKKTDVNRPNAFAPFILKARAPFSVTRFNALQSLNKKGCALLENTP